jgi:hypothetical protein
MRGRHSAGVPSTRARKVAPAVAGGLAVAAIVSAFVAWFVAVPGASASEGQPDTASSAPVACPPGPARC